jgi:hypothetical protein
MTRRCGSATGKRSRTGGRTGGRAEPAVSRARGLSRAPQTGRAERGSLEGRDPRPDQISEQGAFRGVCGKTGGQTSDEESANARKRTWFRLHPRKDDPQRLLDPERQRSEPWGGTIFGRCRKCGGEGRVLHECESCRHRTNPSCPACGGRKRYLAECPACRGSGEVDDSERDGVSVFPDEDGLYRYMLRRDADVDTAKLVEIEGEPTGDEDFDADEGALLIRPSRIVAVRDPDRERMTALGGP